MRWKSVVAAMVVLAAGTAALVYFWPFGARGSVLQLPGVVEIQEVRPGRALAGVFPKSASARAIRSRRAIRLSSWRFPS
jgi:hypothetical protein